jgi:hypothetical protein
MLIFDDREQIQWFILLSTKNIQKKSGSRR